MRRFYIGNQKNEGQKRILINYADEHYQKAQRLQTKTAKIAGFTEVIEYGPEDIEETFRNNNKEIFEYKRGNGLWLWKPYLIKKTLESMEDGEILFYCDSGACFFKSAESVFNILKEQDIWVTVLPLIERQFTKREAFEKMNLVDEEYTDTPQISATFIAFRNTEFSRTFITEWLNCCCNEDILAPVEDRTKECVDFYDHREDQSVLSLLAKRYRIKAWSDPSQYGRLPEKYIRSGCNMIYYGKEDYCPFILHHRLKKIDKKVILKQWFCAVLPRTIGLRMIERRA